MTAPVAGTEGRARVLDGARRVLRRDGPDGVTMRAVAGEVGVTATALYRHYADKDALLRDLVRAEYALFLEYVGAAAAAAGPLPRLHATAERMLDFALEHAAAYELLFVTPHGVGVDQYPVDFVGGRSRGFRALRALVEEGIAAGVVRPDDPTDVALDLYVHAHGLIMLHRAGRFGGDDAVARRFFRRSIARVL